MAELDPDIQIFILQHLAMFEPPTKVMELVKETFNVEITRQAVHYYNADLNPKLPAKWRSLFKRTRKKFLSDTVSIGISHKSFRLRELDKIYQKQASSKAQNTKAMRETLEQAAKESGDAFSNKTKHEVEATVQHAVVRVPPKLSPDEWASQFAGSGTTTGDDGTDE